MSKHAYVPQSLPLQTRLAPMSVTASESRTLEVVFTTGASVRRQNFNGWDAGVPFDEILVVSSEAIDLTRLKAGAPVLDSHLAGTTEAQRAVVEDAWVVSGKGYARLRFPEKGTDPAADRLFDMARQKIIRNISVGYAINRVRIVEPRKAGDIEQRFIERWTPYELSFVTVPADAGAQTRANDPRAFPFAIVGHARGISDVDAARIRMNMRAKSAGSH